MYQYLYIISSLFTPPAQIMSSTASSEGSQRADAPPPAAEQPAQAPPGASQQAEPAAPAAEDPETLGSRAARAAGRDWQGTAGTTTQWYEAVGRPTPLTKLSWDFACEHGQSRPLDDHHVARLLRSLRNWPPTEPVKVTVWDNQKDGTLVILAGQHIAKAICMLADERTKEGLDLMQWQQTVRADILKFATPIGVREVIAGASHC